MAEYPSFPQPKCAPLRTVRRGTGASPNRTRSIDIRQMIERTTTPRCRAELGRTAFNNTFVICVTLITLFPFL